MANSNFNVHLWFKGSFLRLLLPLTLLAFNLALYLPSLHWLGFFLWREDTNSSIGIIPLLISTVWIAASWRRIPNQPPRHPFLAALLLLTGYWVWLAAWSADASILQGESLPLVLAALIWLYGGEAKLRQLAFPVVYLFLVFPLPGLAEHYLSLPLRLWSARLASIFITVLGLPGHLEGTSIVGPQFVFDVAPACSGLKTVYTFLVAGTFVAWVVHRNWRGFAWQVAVIPLATLLANSLRITAIALIGYHFSLEAAMGLAHESAGSFFFAAIFFVFTVIGQKISKRFPHPPRPVTSKPAETISAFPTARSVLPHAVCSLILFLFLVSIELHKKELSHPVQPDISYSLSGWIGQDAPLTSQEADFWGRTYLMKRRYVQDQQVIDFITSTSRSDRHNLHEPTGCYPSQGWQILNQHTEWISAGHDRFPVRYLKLQKPKEGSTDMEELYALFWFQREDQVTLARGMDLLFFSVKERLLLRPEKTWTLYSLAVVKHEESEVQLQEELARFAALLRAETVKPASVGQN